MSNIDESKPYYKYADDVLNDRIKAPKTIKQACARFISWLERDDIYFDEEDVDRKIRFISKLKHSTGKFAGKPFILMPWQAFAIANVYGWKWKDSKLRVTKKAFLYMARKNAKTSTIAALAILGAIADREPQAEVDIVANSHKQAEICFGQIYNYIKSIDPNKKLFNTTRQDIKIPYTNSVIQVHSSDSMTLDGYNSSVSIIDEFHSQKDWDLYNVLMSSMAMRTQPLMFVITTSGFLVGSEYPCYQMWQNCKEILSGEKTDDTQFSLIYEFDEGDNWEDESNWIKPNPSIGETVRYEYLREQLNDAKNNKSLAGGIKTKNFNMWQHGAQYWIQDSIIDKSMQVIDIQDYEQEDSYCGVDLSAVSDLTAWSIMFPPNPDREFYPDKFIFKNYAYLPEDTIETSPNAPQYKQYISRGDLIKTNGNVVDYDNILEDMKRVDAYCNVITWAYDSYNATQLSLNATASGLNFVPFSQSLGNFNRPTKELERLILQGKVVIDTSLLTKFCFRNCELIYDHNDNCKPKKLDGNKNNKIDIVIAMLECLGAYLADIDNGNPDD